MENGNGTKAARTIGAWVKLITAAATAVATVAATATGLYAALEGVKKAEAKAEVADNRANGAYSALASKIDALAIEVAYLKGKIDGREVAIRRAPVEPDFVPVPPTMTKPKSKIEKAPTKSQFKKGARFKVEPFQDLPDKLDDLVQMQEQYQADR